MADVNASINILINTEQASGQLQRLSAQINQFNRSAAASGTSAAARQAAWNKALMDGVNATGAFSARMVPVTSSVERFTHSLEKNKFTLGEYSRLAASQLPGMSRVFRREFDMMERVATDRVKKIQTQYVALGRTANGVQQALASTPLGLGKGYATDMAIAAQRQQIFNKIIDDGSTKMLNWGKNTQWAGRQLMVGFSLPLAALGAVAAKTFMELDKATIAFERVYGDLSTATSEMEANKAAIRDLGQEYTKYGIALKDTIDLSARVAATGAQNEDLYAATEQTLRFATLGQMDYNEALDATISLQSAFNVASKDLGSTIDYLNAVENQTVLTIQDMAAAIPRVAPVIQGLGGDVKDLAVMMTAMREGGVSAENAANALKSGLASLINPTQRAQESMQKLGIDMQAIIDTNRGDLLATVKAFGDALSKVDDFSQQQALEQIFGKYQYARMGALFNNIADGASQATRAMDLAGMSVSELAQLSERELSKIEESTTVKFQAAMENLKIAIAPLGEAFLKVLTPIAEGVTKIAEIFNNFPDIVKNSLALVTGLVAGLGPVVLMAAGLIGNGVANIIKAFQWIRKRLAGIKGDASAFQYLASQELEALGASEALEKSVQSLTGSLNLQKIAVAALAKEYGKYASVTGITAAATRRRGGGATAAAPVAKMARGGVVPGTGTGDKIPALLTPGEFVMNKGASQKFGPVLSAMNSGSVRGFSEGGGTVEIPVGGRTFTANVSARTMANPQSLTNLLDSLERWTAGVDISQEKLDQLGVAIGDVEHSATSLKGVLKTLDPRISARGARVGEGTQAGSSAPLVISRQTEGFRGALRGEVDALAERFAGRVLADTEWDTLSKSDRRDLKGQGYISQSQYENLTDVRALHLEKPDPARKAQSWYTDPLRPDVNTPNVFSERMERSAGTWNSIESRSANIDELMRRNQREFADLGISVQDVDSAFERMASGAEAINEKEAIIRQRMADWDLDLSLAEMRNPTRGAKGKTALGTVAESYHIPEAESAVTAYRREQGTLGASLDRRYAQVDMPDALITTSPRAIQAAEDSGEVLAQAQVKGAKSVADKPGNDLYPMTRDRNSPHRLAGPDGRQDAQAYITAQRAELAALRQSSGMSAKEQYQRTQSETRMLDRVRTDMTARGYSQAQIDRAQRKILANKLREASASATIATAAQKSATTATQTAATESKRAKLALQTIAKQASLNKAYDIQTRMLAQGTPSLGQRIGGGLMRNSGRLGMGLGMASMIPFMAQNEQGQFMGMNANNLGMGMMGAGMALDMASMVKLPMVAGMVTKALAPLGIGLGTAAAALGGVTLAVGAAALAIKIWRNNVDDASRAAAEAGANLGGVANSANTIAEMMGKQTPVQRAAQVQVGDLTETQQANFGEYQAMMETDQGKKLFEDLKSATSADRFKMLSDYVKNAVATGLMDSDFAAGWVKTVSAELGDGLLGKNVLSDLEKFSKDMKSNTEGMLTLANERMAASDASAAMQQVGTGQTMSYENASNVIGQAIQGIQDFGNVAALAEEDFANGKISYSAYIDALNQSTAAQNSYTQAILYALQNNTDSGGTQQALVDQLSKATGMDTEVASEILSVVDQGRAGQAAVEAENQRRGAAKGEAMAAAAAATKAAQDKWRFNPTDENRRAFEQAQMNELSVQNMPAQVSAKEALDISAQAEGQASEIGAALVSAIISGMPIEDAKAVAENMMTDPNGPAAKAFNAAMAGGATQIAAFQGAAIARREQQKPTAGLEGKTGGYASAYGVMGGKGGATPQEFDSYIQGLPEDKRAGFLDWVNSGQQKKNLSGEKGKQWLQSAKAAQTAAGGADVSALTQSAAWIDAIDEGKVEDITTKISELKAELGGDQGRIQAYIDFAMEDPNNVAETLPEITDKLIEFNDAVPPEIQKMLGINIENPEDIDKLMENPEAYENLKFISDTLQGIPDETTKTLAASVAFDANGDPKDPKDFLMDFKKIDAAFGKLKSKKTSVKKQAVYDIMTLQNGEEADMATIDAAQKALEDKFNKQVIANLPPDIYYKAIQAQYDATQLKEQADGLDKAAADLAGIPGLEPMVSQMKEQAAALRSAAANAESAAASAVASGAGSAVQNSNTGGGNGGGGGGGEKANPYKDFKEEIVNQIKLFGDMEVSLKNLMSKKNNFFNLLKANNGLDDQIRRAGIAGPMAEELMGMDPKDAKKIMAKITGKNGKLNAEGRKLQDRYMAGQILETDYNNQMSIDNAMAQSRALRNSQVRNNYVMPKKPNKAYGRFTGTGLNSYGMEALTDPAIAKQYNYLADKFLQASRRTGAGAVKAYNQAAKALSDYTKKMEKAATLQAGMAAIVEYDISKKKARETASLVSQAQAAGLDQRFVDEIASGAQTDRYMGLVAARDQARKEAKANPNDKAAQKRWREAQAAVDNFFTNFEADMQKLEEEAAKANPLQYMSDQIDKEIDVINTNIETITATLTEASDIQFSAEFGKTKDEAELLIKKNNAIIMQYQQQIDAIQTKIAGIQREVDLLEHSKKAYQDQIDKIQDIIDAHQRRIDELQHENDLRSHQMDLINHELDLMSKAEDAINKTYDKRIEALTQVQQMNDHLIQQQQTQLGLAQALSQGDVYAAAAAAQQMQGQQAQYAGEMNMQALEQGRENAIGGLRTSEGMTREQAEERIWQLGQQNWQTEQLIYDINQKIYAENLKILPLKDAINAIDDQIAVKNELIWQKNQEIYDIQSKSIDPLVAQNKEWQNRLDLSAANLEVAILDATQNERAQLRTLKLQQQQIKQTQAQAERTNYLAKAWKNVAEQIAEANSLLNDRTKLVAKGKWEELGELTAYTDDGAVDYNETMLNVQEEYQKELARIREQMANLGKDTALYKGGMIKKFAAGSVVGDGARDSVSAVLTPGEFVIRKSMVDKYGLPMFESINQGSFSVPRYNFADPSTMSPSSGSGKGGTTIAAPVYNTYSVNVNANTNANADDIANTVLNKIRSIDSMSVRRVNGY